MGRLNPSPSRGAVLGTGAGTIELVIHDGQVVQLERLEKVLFHDGVTE